MRGADVQAEFQELLAYPEHCFGEPACERWLDLCSSLKTYQAPSLNFPIEKGRKWELVSALQKAIRRADKATALKLISGVASIPEEYAYFWRRMCVIAAEDVGPADDTLVKFVVVCATVFSPKKMGPENHRLLGFLAERMCDLPTRSRICCNLDGVSLAVEKGELPSLGVEDSMILDAIARQKAAVHAANTPLFEWQKKNGWRAEGLLRFVGLALPLEMEVRSEPVPPCRAIFELPSYCYDTHTRIGLSVLRRLVHGVPEAQAIRDFFQRNKTNTPHRALGEALFTVEGGREKDELVYPSLCSLEQRVAAYQFGLPFDQWLRLCDLILETLEKGVIDRLREEVLCQQYGQKTLEFVCQ
jgi:hypothetical protein